MRNTFSIYQRLVRKSMDWSLGVKAETKLVGMALRVIPLIFGHLTGGYVKAIWVWSCYVAKMYRRSGYKGVAVYLKTCYVCLQQVAGGMVPVSPMEIGCTISRTRRGVPRIINVIHRRRILQGDVLVIRLWLTLFGLYRVLPFKGKLKLNTITDPGKDLRVFLREWRAWVPVFLGRANRLGKPWSFSVTRDLYVETFPMITKSAPNSKGAPSYVGLPLDLLAFWQDPQMRKVLRYWLLKTENKRLKHSLDSLFHGYDRMVERAEKLPWYRKSIAMKKPNPIQFLRIRSDDWRRQAWVAAVWQEPLWFGRLGFKEEPGKIRVFAMVNLITQALMRPLHEWLFARLRDIPTDGTFDQVAPVERLVKRIGGKGWIASYDLSAATDRLPVVIQIALLEPLLGKDLASMWAFLLVSRPYGLPKKAKSYNLGVNAVYYAVGQPMGALSSWAMLAVTHHALVQLAAYRAYPGRKGWFMDYAVLGDDIVIADKAVAKNYLDLMDTLGVKVGLSKSLISPNGSLEFAKRTWIKGRQATPFSLAEISVATNNVAALEELWRTAKSYGAIRVAAVARFLGYGYKNLARLPVGFSLNNRLSRLLGYLSRPGGLFPVSFESWVYAVGPGFKVGLGFEQEREIAKALVTDLATLIGNYLSKVEREINRVWQSEISFATKKVRRKSTVMGLKGRRQEIKRSFVYGPEFREFILAEYATLWDEFAKSWVFEPYISKVSKACSRLRVRLRGFTPSSIHGFNGVEMTWRWIEDLSAELKALPSEINLFDRQDDVRVTPSAKIRLWMKLRRCAKKASNPNKPPKPIVLMKNEYGAWQRQY